MAADSQEKQFRQQMHRLDALIKELEHKGDPESRRRAKEVVGLLMDIHGMGLNRMLERLASTEAGMAMIHSLAEDEVAAGLLLLYGLHPLDLDTRVHQALEKVRPYLASHGGNVELLGTTDGLVRLRLEGSCHGCPSSALTLKQTIEEAIYEKAPDILGIEVEGDTGAVPEQDPQAKSTARFALPILAK